jgi:hypothetical protein
LNTFYTQQKTFTLSGGLNVLNAIKALGWSATKDNFFNPDKVANDICSGFKIIVHVNDFSHFVNITGQKYDPVTKRCRLLMADPSNSTTKYLDDPSIISIDEIYTINTGLGL